MRIAAPTDDAGNIAQHLGKSLQFTLVDARDGKFSREIAVLPETGHIAVVSMLAERQADVLICGELGLMARSALQMLELTLVPGCTGPVDAAITKFLAGETQGDPSILTREIPELPDDPMACMHDCATCHGCHAGPEQIPEEVQKRIPEL